MPLAGRLLGSFLHLSPEYTFVLEDEGGPCGYAAGALCAEGFLRERASSWLPAMRHKYPRELGVGGPALGQVRGASAVVGSGGGRSEGSFTCACHLQDALEEALLFFHAEPPAVPLPVLRRFPSLVQLGTAPRVLDVGASRSLAVCLLSALRANGELHVGGSGTTPSTQRNPITTPCPPRSWGQPSLGLPFLQSDPSSLAP